MGNRSNSHLISSHNLLRGTRRARPWCLRRRFVRDLRQLVAMRQIMREYDELPLQLCRQLDQGGQDDHERPGRLPGEQLMLQRLHDLGAVECWI